MKTKPPIVGSKIKYWFDGGLLNGESTILSVRKYTGRYPEYFHWIVKLSSVNVPGGIETVM